MVISHRRDYFVGQQFAFGWGGGEIIKTDIQVKIITSIKICQVLVQNVLIGWRGMLYCMYVVL